jgi:hypothetical protein
LPQARAIPGQLDALRMPWGERAAWTEEVRVGEACDEDLAFAMTGTMSALPLGFGQEPARHPVVIAMS